MSSLPIIPPSIMTDSYKAGHFAQYPRAQKMVAYGEFRRAYDKDTEDTRFVYYGIRYLVKHYLLSQWTMDDVEKADKFYSTHNAGYTPYPYPKELFAKFVKENNGYFPVRVESLREGSCAHARVPVYQIIAEKEYSQLVTFLETILTQLWYPSTVATLSRRSRTLIEKYFSETVDEDSALQALVETKLHDFGFRGCTCVEQSLLGGSAHLLNFIGTDTMSAAYYVQYELNDGKPLAVSIPATEHSVMTSWPTEGAAIRNLIEKFGGDGRVFACVMDSYDYAAALDRVLPNVLKTTPLGKGAVMVLRPDSGDPVDVILMALKAGDKIVGHTVNKKGYKVLNGINAIQGDGIGYKEIAAILEAVKKEGYSAQNVAFGMGAGLLQKLNRDTMSFATKLCFIRYEDGEPRKVMKKPKGITSKISFPGILKVVKNEKGIPTIYPHEDGAEPDPNNMLEVVYDNGPVEGYKWENFSEVRARVDREWKSLPPTADPISEELKKEIEEWGAAFEKARKERSQ